MKWCILQVGGTAPLRARVSAAPLKHYVRVGFGRLLGSPPRPVEAVGAANELQVRFASPRSRERGPVEAETLSVPFRDVSHPLRARVSAAPLKRNHPPRGVDHPSTLRARVSAAPLKRIKGHIL